MNAAIPGLSDNTSSTTLYYGTRAELEPGDVIVPSDFHQLSDGKKMAACVYLTSSLDEAIWDAELDIGKGAGRVYVIEPTGKVGHVSDLPNRKSPGHPSMSYYSCEELRVTGEVTDWTLYHGTRADLKPGDLLKPAQTPNFGNRANKSSFVYFTRTLDAATWGAELASGDGRGRIYVVEPTGPIEDDPNLTDKKFRGNPTKSFRSREPLRILGEVTNWKGHSPEAIQAMKNGLERLARLGVEPIND